MIPKFSNLPPAIARAGGQTLPQPPDLPPGSSEGNPEVDDEMLQILLQKTKLVRKRVETLNDLATQNKKDAERANFMFWLFKFLTAAASASAGIFSFLKWDLAGAIAGGIGVIIVAIDSKYPSSTLRSIGRQAYIDLSYLSNKLVDEWDLVCSKETDPAKINIDAMMKNADKELKRIIDYIKTAESW